MIIVPRRVEKERVGVGVSGAGIIGPLKIRISCCKRRAVGQRKGGSVVPQNVIERVGDETATARGTGIRFVVTAKAEVIVGDGAVIDTGDRVVLHRNTG